MYSDLAVSQSSKLETTSSYSIRRMKLKSKIISHLNHPCRHPLQTLFGTHDEWWNFVCIFKTEGLYHYTVNYILFRIIRSIGNVSLSNLKAINLHLYMAKLSVGVQAARLTSYCMPRRLIIQTLDAYDLFSELIRFSEALTCIRLVVAIKWFSAKNFCCNFSA